MKVCVTGGSGFIGSNFIHYFLDKNKDSQILNYDKLTYAGNPANLDGIDNTRYQFVQGDICDYSFFKEALHKFKPEIVIAFAAESHVDRSITSPQEFLQTNVLGTESVLRVIRDLQIKKLIHISTDECYGSLESPLQATEESKFDPNSPYSVSKAAGDMLCHAYYVTYGVPVVVIRGSNCFGPRQHPEKFIPKSIVNLIKDNPIGIYGGGTNVREWIFTEDFCKGVEVVSSKGKLGEAYNLGGGYHNRYTNNVVAENLCQIFNKSMDSHIKYIPDRLGHDKRYALDSNKLEKLGWRSNYTLKEGLIKTVDWYQKNETWWKSLI